MEETHSDLFPQALAVTDMHSDLVVFSAEKREATLVESTILFESNIEDAQQWKQSKYHDIVEVVRANGFDVMLIMIEVDSEGLPVWMVFTRFVTSPLPANNDMHCLLIDVSRAAITGSYKIWTSRNQQIAWSTFSLLFYVIMHVMSLVNVLILAIVR